MAEYKNLELDYRMYQYIRNNSITNIYDALIELITNSIDAYSTMEGKKTICIKYCAMKREICVIDNAIGLTGEQMNKAFLTVGKYLSDDNKRGHFSRGAKDISAIANVTFTSIKDDKCSECKILSNGTGALLVTDKDATTVDRDHCCVASGNGLHVKMELIDTVDLTVDWNKLAKHYALRDILTDPNVEICIMPSGQDKFMLKYTAPEGLEKLVGVEYQVPYYDVPAKFEVYLDRNDALSINDDMRFSENGFILKSFNTIYENSTLNNRFIFRHPKFHMLNGTLECDYINTLLKDYENNGPSEKNPFPIIDTARLSGLNKSHPFVKHLMRLPQERVLHILTSLQYESSNQDKKLNLSELLASLHDLEILGNEIFEKLDIELISDLYFTGDDLPENKIDLADVQHTGIEEDLPFSKENINERRQQEAEQLENLLKRGAKLDINFVEKTFDGKFEVNVSNQGIAIDIPLTNSVVQRYLGTEEEGYPGSTDTRFLVALSDIIIESFAKILADNDQANLDTTGMTSQEIVTVYNASYDKYYDLYDDKIYDVILG